MSKYQDKQLYLGVDGGGSKCRAVIFCPEQGIIAEAVSGPANVLRGSAKAINNIVKATDEALASLSLPAEYKSQLIAGIGLAGLNLESCMIEMQVWSHPFKQVSFTSDLHIACIGAHSGKDGAVMIIGTGSSALVSNQNKINELGGHGFPVGDCGSGAWLGLNAIEVTLECLDGLKPETKLTKSIADFYDVDTAINLAQIVSTFVPADFAKLAPLIMEHAKQQDVYALQLVQTGADYLSRVALKLMEEKTLPLSLIGGLSPLMANYFDEQVKQLLKPAENPPEMGAVLFAQQSAAIQTN